MLVCNLASEDITIISTLYIFINFGLKLKKHEKTFDFSHE